MCVEDCEADSAQDRHGRRRDRCGGVSQWSPETGSAPRAAWASGDL